MGAIDDPLEHEADRVADHVMRMASPPALRNSAKPQVGRKCTECEEEKVQRKEAGPQVSPADLPASVHQTLRSPGKPLDPESRAFFEPRFGSDFSHVRIHTDAGSAESAQSLAARAYTFNSHIVFGSGEYSPASQSGRHLLAHELGHVIQQTTAPAARTAPTIRRQAVPPEEFARLIEEIDAKLENPKLTDSERIALLRKRHEYFAYLKHQEDSQQGVPASYRYTAPSPPPPSGPKATPKFQSPAQPQPAPPAQAPAQKLKPVPSTGTKGSSASSAKALGSKDAAKPTVPPPSTPYVDTNAPSRNPAEAAKRAEEGAIGKQLNEMAIRGRLGDVRRVEGHRPVEGDSADYKFFLKDGSSVSADLYSPEPGTEPEDAALHATRDKSQQGEVMVLHLTGIQKPQKYAQRVAESLIATGNHSLKKMIVFSDNRLLITRTLVVQGEALAKIKQRVDARLAEQAKSEMVTRPNQQSRPSTEPPKLTAAQIEQLRSQQSANEVKTMFAEGARKFEEKSDSPKKGVFYDPHAVNIESPTGTHISTQGAVEGAGQMVLGAQLDSARSAEMQKAIDAWNALQPKIEKLQSSGFDVTVVVVAQVPKQPDVAAYATGVGDASQVVYFQTMYIGDKSLHRRPGAPTQPPPGGPQRDQGPTMGPAPADPDREIQSAYGPDRYEDPAWINVMQENYEIFGHAGTYKPPRDGFRYETRTMVVPGY